MFLVLVFPSKHEVSLLNLSNFRIYGKISANEETLLMWCNSKYEVQSWGSADKIKKIAAGDSFPFTMRAFYFTLLRKLLHQPKKQVKKLPPCKSPMSTRIREQCVPFKEPTVTQLLKHSFRSSFATSNRTYDNSIKVQNTI